MGGFSTRLIVTHAYICFSATSTGARAPTSLMAECSPTRLPEGKIQSFGGTLDARLLSTHGRSTSELLRTL